MLLVSSPIFDLDQIKTLRTVTGVEKQDEKPEQPEQTLGEKIEALNSVKINQKRPPLTQRAERTYRKTTAASG